YDKKERLVCRAILKDGFLIKEYDLFKDYGLLFEDQNKYHGRLFGVSEFTNNKKNIEENGNFFNKQGKYGYDAHDMFDGYKWTQVPGNKNLEPWEIEISDGWFSSKANFSQYKMFIDPIGHDGKKAASIKSISKKVKDD